MIRHKILYGNWDKHSKKQFRSADLPHGCSLPHYRQNQQQLLTFSGAVIISAYILAQIQNMLNVQIYYPGTFPEQI